ncbi:MAG: DUF4097 family beta strand repeat-containing protein [candidate division Zixibacteria bacterium]|nr:DUF4097 family beta strand repeat-containing protein [candidate division Zixibacteria bacterium]
MVDARMVMIPMLLLLPAASAANAKEFTFPYQKSIDVGTAVQLTVANLAGEVRVQTTTEGQLVVEAVKHVNAADRREADSVVAGMEIEVIALEGHYTVRPIYPDDENRSESFWQKLLGKSGGAACGAIDITISTPSDCDADISCQSGGITVDGLDGKVAISSASGDIIAGGIIGGVTVTTASGDVAVRTVEGPVTVTTESGDVDFHTITGPVDIRNNSGRTMGEDLVGDLTIMQLNGSIDLRRIDGDLRLKAGSGKIGVEQQSGALSVTAESGDIVIRTDLISDKDFTVETASGSIEFSVPLSASGSIRMETGSGRIDTELPLAFDIFEKNRITGSFGEDGPSISLSTLSGNIKLSEY